MTHGQKAYEAYAPLVMSGSGGTTIPWASLPQMLRDAWEAAANAAILDHDPTYVPPDPGP